MQKRQRKYLTYGSGWSILPPRSRMINPSTTPNKENMRSVTVRKGEPIDRALKRLKTKLDTEGILEEMRRRRAFESPMDEKRRKARSASKRNKVKWRFTNKEEIPAAAVTPAED